MTHKDLTRCFLSFNRWVGATAFGNGNINDTYRVDIIRAGVPYSYLLQRLNHHVFREPDKVMQNISSVCTHLGSQEYPYTVVAPLGTPDGQLLQRDEKGDYWRMFPFIENSFAPEGLADAGIAYDAARAYGAFARAMRHFPADKLEETIPGFHDTDRRWAGFLEILAKDPARRAAGTRRETEAMLAAKPVFDRISALKKSGDLPLRVTHNDTKAGNVLFDTGTRKALAVIDLDTVMPGTILSDFGDMVRTFAPDRQEDAPANVVLRRDVLEALKEGFLQETEEFLNASEKENLMLGAAWITGEQALRFLTDWLAGDVYYKIKHPEHNLVRTRNQLALLEAIKIEMTGA